ncbi:MAG TPA: hypothetical protein VK479_09185, partial [Micropepsaceae bacterium]|nr:hypothetical protein [Micropepsaceae bacterium]
LRWGVRSAEQSREGRDLGGCRIWGWKAAFAAKLIGHNDEGYRVPKHETQGHEGYDLPTNRRGNKQSRRDTHFIETIPAKM